MQMWLKTHSGETWTTHMEPFVDCIGGWWWSWVLSDSIGVSEFHSVEGFHARHEEFPRSGARRH